MAKKKKTKAKKSALRFFIFGSSCIALICFVFLSFTKIWAQIYGKYKEKQQLEIKLNKLKEEEKSLSLDVQKMQDSEYIGRYLREKYLYSKNDEYIIRIPEKK